MMISIIIIVFFIILFAAFWSVTILRWKSPTSARARTFRRRAWWCRSRARWRGWRPRWYAMRRARRRWTSTRTAWCCGSCWRARRPTRTSTRTRSCGAWAATSSACPYRARHRTASACSSSCASTSSRAIGPRSAKSSNISRSYAPPTSSYATTSSSSRSRTCGRTR